LEQRVRGREARALGILPPRLHHSIGHVVAAFGEDSLEFWLGEAAKPGREFFPGALEVGEGLEGLFESLQGEGVTEEH